MIPAAPTPLLAAFDAREATITIAYLTASVLFILGLKFLSSPKTAVRGNQIAAVGMLIAIVATLFAAQVIANRPDGYAC